MLQMFFFFLLDNYERKENQSEFKKNILDEKLTN